MRFEAGVGRRTDLVGFSHLNPQLQEKVIRMERGRHDWDRGKPRYAKAVRRRAAPSTAPRGRTRSRAPP